MARFTRLTGAAVFVVGVGLLAGCSSSDSSTTATTSPVPATSASTTAERTDVETAEASAEKFFSLLQRNDVEGLDEFLSPGFQLIRADGSTADKPQYLANPADVSNFELSDFSVGRQGDAIAALYTVTTTEEIDRQLYTEDPRQRLSVFVDNNGEWQLIAHANLNTPREDIEPVTQSPSPLTTEAPPEIVAEAEKVQNDFFQAIVDKDTSALDDLLSPAFLLVRADGSSATKEQYLANPADISSFELSDFAVTSDGNVMVARFSGTTAETIDGVEYSTEPAPRFAVMVNDNGTWRIIGQVNFNSPK